MSYEDKEIKTIINEIKENKIYLPAIQRKLVWKHEQIEKLFDSIMKKYPIGTFLFWKLKGNAINNYTFYKFIQEYKHKLTKNEIAPKPKIRSEITGVLDGQQRLNSIYIALQGTYAYKKPNARWDNIKAFPKRQFYLNLLYINDTHEEEFAFCDECGYGNIPNDASICPNCGTEFEEDDEEQNLSYEFKFLTEEESNLIDQHNYWFPVKEVLTWKEVTSIDEYYEDILEKSSELSEIMKDKTKKRLFKNNLNLLWQRLNQDKIISYYEIFEEELDKIVDIFVRVNSGGTILSRTDLLFSTIVAHWEDGRDEIENLLESLNKKGDGFNFNNDFIMRACLVLTDAPVLFKVQTFKKNNIKKIKDNWDNIKSSIERTIDLLIEFGFSRDNLTSQMSIIPIAYFFIKKGLTYKINNEDKKLIQEYLVKSLLKQIYGGQGDQVLTKIRETLRNKKKINEIEEYILNSEHFPLNHIKESDLPGTKSLKLTEEDIDAILEYKKGPYSFMVLSLLYPNLKYGQVKFHQDHIHPNSLLTKSKLSKLNINDELIEFCIDKKDRLPNLQIMEGKENESKNNTFLKDWFENNVTDKKKYKEDNYFPLDENLDLTNFKNFYDKRRKIIKEKLINLLI